MKNVEEFCDVKGINSHMREAFEAYLRSQYAQEFSLANGDTVKLTVSKMNEDELEKAWNKFVGDFKRYLASKAPSTSSRK